MNVQVIFAILHVLSCMTLVIAALYWKLTHKAGEGAHRFLFPYLMAAGILGLSWIMVPIVRIAILYGSGSTYITMRFRMTGPYAWAYLLVILFPILPCIGIFPAIGKKPFLVASLALPAMLPAAFAIYFELISNP